MVASPLVEPKIEAARRLIEALDAKDFDLVAAFWALTDEFDDWRLILASPLVDHEGPRKAYEVVQRSLDELWPRSGFQPGAFQADAFQMRPLELLDITVVGTQHDLVKLIRSAVNTGAGIANVRLTRNTINGVFVEDAYIYRS